MARTLNSVTSRHAFGDIVASGLTPSGLEQFKLERLLELRAIINAMRAEQTLDRRSEAGRTDSRRPTR